MPLLALIITGCAKLVSALIRWLSQIHLFLSGILPALLPPDRLGILMRRYYDRSYERAGRHIPLSAYTWSLEPWEEHVLAQHLPRSATILILGSGLGRESLELAQRGYQVVALDFAYSGLLIGAQRAASLNLSIIFIQANFLALPIRPASATGILLSGVMYSAIPGRARRQGWLQNLRNCLTPGGKLVLNFLTTSRESASPGSRLIQICTSFIRRWPGSNKAYQNGDTCANGHFMHIFENEEELREEIVETGATLIELSWSDGFVVLS